MSDARKVLDQIRQRAENATEGPWEFRVDTPSMSGACWSLRRAGVPGLRMVVQEYQHGPGNAEFIAAARSDVPRLVAFALAVLDLADEFQSHHEYPPFTGNYDIDMSAGATWYEAEGRLRAAITEHLTNGDDR